MLTNNYVVGKLGKKNGRSQSLPKAEASHLRWPVSPSARPVPTKPGKQRPLRKSVVERFAALTREERTFGSQSQLSAEASHASHGQSGINADSLHFFSFRMRKIRPRIMDSILFICSLTSS